MELLEFIRKQEFRSNAGDVIKRMRHNYSLKQKLDNIGYGTSVSLTIAECDELLYTILQMFNVKLKTTTTPAIIKPIPVKIISPAPSPTIISTSPPPPPPLPPPPPPEPMDFEKTDIEQTLTQAINPNVKFLEEIQSGVKLKPITIVDKPPPPPSSANIIAEALYNKLNLRREAVAESDDQDNNEEWSTA
ncbi:hypothetical protein SlGVgp002 [Spodoptera litura granulovirus]|uniref:P78/83 n=1 Tax=Spodoptera litura granulovirus TaxID=359919 RepID=A5IZK4_9BBAC|nr:hypothetical protein SlGVgp002 [Spodoptera litura granulovirus]ABQ51945.1 hypothetical protein SlGVgp002 [Spodoptera litura granulovirus]